MYLRGLMKQQTHIPGIVYLQMCKYLECICNYDLTNVNQSECYSFQNKQ